MTNSSDESRSRFGQFIQAYSSFLSTFVIGAAGLVATSIWQYGSPRSRRGRPSRSQKIATTQAENTWRIERAEILAKKPRGALGGRARDGRAALRALLSLTRGNILDPELAVSYALELGKDNADYIGSVLGSTQDKSYPAPGHRLRAQLPGALRHHP
jgi:hypothetical protein